MFLNNKCVSYDPHHVYVMPSVQVLEIVGAPRREWLTVIEPIPKAIEPILHQVLRCSEVEPRIDCFSISS